MIKSYFGPLRFILFAVAMLIVLIFFNGTGQEADSINHYLFAKYAVSHPELYLNHWAKPIFTLFASPFAQFGFIGVKIFNCICTLLAIFFSERILAQLKIKNTWLVGFLILLMPLSYLVTFSSLTEPFGALMLVLGIYLAIKDKPILAAIIISFLPFVRSEGLLIIAVFGLYYFIKNNWKIIPLLLSGHLVYSLVGFLYYEDLLWVFTKIPYASLSSHYGSGSIWHFTEKFVYVTGIPIVILFVLGLIALSKDFFQKGLPKNPVILLVLNSFLLFFLAHSLFWAFGLFNSMGLKRVLGCVIPLIAIISVYGFNFLFEFIRNKKVKHAFQAIFLIYTFGFNFTSNPAAVEWEDLNLSTSQELANEVGLWLNETYQTVPRLIYSDPYLSESFNIDPFNPKLHLTLNSPEKLNIQGLIIWDNWHSVIDSDIQLDMLESNPNLKLIKVFEKGKSKYVIFKR